MKVLLGLLVLFAQIALADEENHSDGIPSPIQDAFRLVHDEASISHVRNLFMFNYSYYSGGFCKDQDCSDAKIATEIAAAKSKMGDDFTKYSQFELDYKRVIGHIQAELPTGDLGSLSGLRSAHQILHQNIFVSCVDFAKAVMAKALAFGFPKDDLKIFITMQKDGYQKMCPNGPNGSKPVMPRPLVHTLVAYRFGGKWYALNVEDPQAMPLPIGAELPKRLAQDFLFTYPALIAYQKLVYAGSFDPKDFIDGYPFNWLVGITASGKLETDLSKVVCE